MASSGSSRSSRERFSGSESSGLSRSTEILPVIDECDAHASEPRAHLVARLGERLHHVAHSTIDDFARGTRQDLTARFLETGALVAHEPGRFLDLAGELLFGLAESAARRLVENVELLGADGLAMQDGKGLDPALDGPNAESESLCERLEIPDDRPILRFELAGELGLRALEIVPLHDAGNLVLQPVDELGHLGDQGWPETRRQQQRSRSLGMVEVVHVHDVARRWPSVGEPCCITHDVVLDHHLRLGGDEHVKAWLTSRESEFERTPSRVRYELEETSTRLRGLGQQIRVGAQNEPVRRHPVAKSSPLASGSVLRAAVAGLRGALGLQPPGARGRRGGPRLAPLVDCGDGGTPRSAPLVDPRWRRGWRDPWVIGLGVHPGLLGGARGRPRSAPLYDSFYGLSMGGSAC